MRIAPIASKRVLENVQPDPISRKLPPIVSGRIDWATIGEACGIEEEMTTHLKTQLRPGLDVIIRTQ